MQNLGGQTECIMGNWKGNNGSEQLKHGISRALDLHRHVPKLSPLYCSNKLLSWYVSCERNIHSSASKRPISEAQFKNCWIVTARSRSLTESLKIPLVRQNWGRQYTACKEYYNVYVEWIHVHIKSQISISNLYFNTVKIHQVFCYI